MPDFEQAFLPLRAVLEKRAGLLAVKVNTAAEYTLHTRVASPFPQHDGQTMFFGSARLGKAYASFHLMPLYMCEKLTSTISPALRKRMQGKTCFNFKARPEPELLAELEKLTEAGIKLWSEKKWV
jgi:hypothetical protein